MHALLKEIEAVPTLRRFGRVARIEGLLVEVTGAAGAISLGGQVRLSGAGGAGNLLAKWSVSATGGRWSCRWARWTGSRSAPAPISTTSRPRSFRPRPGWAGSSTPLAQPTRRQGAAAPRARRLCGQGAAAGGPCARQGRRQARSGRARAQHLRHLLQGPAHGHLLGLGRRQIDLDVDDGAQHRRRCHRHRAGRRTRPRAQGIHRGRSGRGRPGACGGGGRHLRRAARWCAARPPMWR